MPGGIEQIIFADNSTLNLTDIASQHAATEGPDWIVGTEAANTISALGGDDIVEAMGGNDILIGGTGNDQLSGGSGSDVLDGGPGDDAIAGGKSGSTGRSPDFVGSDTVLFGRGDGRDSVSFTQYVTGTDIIRFKPGVLPQDVYINHAVSQKGTAFFLGIQGGTDGMQIGMDAYNEILSVEEIRFTDAPTTVWGSAEIKAALRVSTTGDDYIQGFSEHETLRGDAGNDRIVAERGNDVLYGGAGNDHRSGGEGNDLLYGGSGDDSFESIQVMTEQGGNWEMMSSQLFGVRRLGAARFVFFNVGDGHEELIGKATTTTTAPGCLQSHRNRSTNLIFNRLGKRSHNFKVWMDTQLCAQQQRLMD